MNLVSIYAFRVIIVFFFCQQNVSGFFENNGLYLAREVLASNYLEKVRL